jgi:hypothetical protein
MFIAWVPARTTNLREDNNGAPEFSRTNFATLSPRGGLFGNDPFSGYEQTSGGSPTMSSRRTQSIGQAVMIN